MPARTCLRSVLLLLVLLLVSALAALPAAAQDPRPSPGDESVGPPASWEPRMERPAPAAALLLDATAGGLPDDYGYTVAEEPLAWIDASAGVETGLRGDNARTGAIDLGFSFPFYERAYTQAYLTTNGLLSFAGADAARNWAIPNPAGPNNMIAVLWDDLAVGDGRIYYRRGGTAPARYFVAEWRQVTRASGGGPLTFEAVLYENGDILLQYQTLNGEPASATVGIEDEDGVDGQQVLFNSTGLAAGTAIRFCRPGARARVKLFPAYQGLLTRAGGEAVFPLTLRNSGNMGADTFRLELSSGWPARLCRADGSTPLSDTDGDGVVDTGSLAPGAEAKITVILQAPAGARTGDYGRAVLTVRSRLDGGMVRTATLQAAIPAAFAQVYRDRADQAMSLFLAQPGAQTVLKAAPDGTGGLDPAIVATPQGLAYFWTCTRTTAGGTPVSEIEYALLSASGAVRRTGKVIDRSTVSQPTRDQRPSVTVAPDGRLGLAWYCTQERMQGNERQINSNVFFAILDHDGNLSVGPVNITKNSAWGTGAAIGVPFHFNPDVVATSDDRFVLSWRQNRNEAAGWVTDIWYAVYDGNGTRIAMPARITADTPGPTEAFYTPSLCALSGNRALLAWNKSSDSSIHYAILDSAGHVVRPDSALYAGQGWGWGPVAAQFPDGRILMAWNGAPAANPGETGWEGRYYNNETLTEPAVLVRRDETISFDWGAGSPAPGVNADHFSVRWTGVIHVPRGMYYFSLGAGSGGRLWIDGRLVMDYWHEAGRGRGAEVLLTEGAHTVRVEMHDAGSTAAYASLIWHPARPVTRYAILSQSGAPTGGWTAIDNPASGGDDYVSVAMDREGRAILTWTDAEIWTEVNEGVRHRLYYALVGQDGRLLTPAQILYSAGGDDRDVHTNFWGQGVAALPAQVEGEQAYLPLVMGR